MVARQGLSSCHNATVPVLDLTNASNAQFAVCRDVVHKARATDEYHDVNKCDLNPKEVKYLVNGVWHNLSRDHLSKIEMRRVHSRSVKLSPYFILKVCTNYCYYYYYYYYCYRCYYYDYDYYY